MPADEEDAPAPELEEADDNPEVDDETTPPVELVDGALEEDAPGKEDGPATLDEARPDVVMLNEDEEGELLDTRNCDDDCATEDDRASREDEATAWPASSGSLGVLDPAATHPAAARTSQPCTATATKP